MIPPYKIYDKRAENQNIHAYQGIIGNVPPIMVPLIFSLYKKRWENVRIDESRLGWKEFIFKIVGQFGEFEELHFRLYHDHLFQAQRLFK